MVGGRSSLCVVYEVGFRMMRDNIGLCSRCGCQKVLDEGGVCRKCHVDYDWIHKGKV